jgi:NADH-quinone oxidoreductase subunit L
MGGEQDMRKMGGLRAKTPITFWTMTMAVLAISGFPFMSAFFSKDAILAAAFASGSLGKLLWFVGLVTAGLTAFYMFRLWYLTFFGETRSHDAHPHESPWSMRGPLVILAVLSVGGGWIGAGRFGAFLSPVLGTNTEEMAGSLEYVMMALAVAAGAIGWFIAHRMYHQRAAAQIAAPAPAGYTLLQNKYYVDEFYGLTIVKPLIAVSKYFLEWVVDIAILGGLAWALSALAVFFGAILQRWQSGNIRSYAAWLALGAAVLLYFVLAPHVFGAPSLHLGMAGH